MKKILPVSLLAIWVACPALAENFPNDGYMLENKTYDNAATYENMGVYSDSVEANAYYEVCPANSYCDASGQHSCPSGYPNSAAGAGASTECYKACTVANVPHAYAVTGNDYNGGTTSCSAISCVSGYHKQMVSANLYPVIGLETGTAYAGTTSTGADVNELVGDWEWIAGEDAAVGIGMYNISGPMVFAVDYGNRGVIKGHGRCSTRDFDPDTYVTGEYTIQDANFVETLTEEAGQAGAYNCYCKIDSYTPVGGESQVLTGPWVFVENTSGPEGEEASACAYSCAISCAKSLFYSDDGSILRAAVLGAFSGNVLATCAANTITINWSDVDDDGSATTLATDVLYDGDIDTPVKAATYPGKIFTGWRFVAPEEEGGS